MEEKKAEAQVASFAHEPKGKGHATVFYFPFSIQSLGWAEGGEEGGSEPGLGTAFAVLLKPSWTEHMGEGASFIAHANHPVSDITPQSRPCP